MGPVLSVGCETMVAEIVAHARHKMQAAHTPPQEIDAVAEFIGQFYRTVPPDDVLGKPLEYLYGSGRSAWGLAQKRRPGELLLRVFNPSHAENGWSCEHTVVEVVNDDMPFLVDSVTGTLNDLGLETLVLIHPVVAVERDAKGALAALLPADAGDGGQGQAESVMHLEVTRQSDAAMLERIAKELSATLSDVRAAVEDWEAMRGRIDEALTEGFPEGGDDPLECRAFLEWLRQHHFTMLGARVYHAVGKGGAQTLKLDPDSGLGVLRDPERRVFDELQTNAAGQVETRIFGDEGPSVLVTKSNRRATVHRPVAMDAIVVKRRNAEGHVIGVWLFVGLFTADVYTNSPLAVPMLHGKITRVIAAAGYKRKGHDGKKLLSILENLPRDELFQSSEAHLGRVAVGILQLHERRRAALFVRPDDFERFISCLVYVPRDRFDTALRHAIQDILAKAFDGTILSYYTQIADAPLARLHVIVRTRPGAVPVFDAREVEARIAAVARAWDDRLRDALVRGLGEERAANLHRRYGRAFPTNYTEHFDAEAAVYDIERVEEILASGVLGMNLYRPLEAPETEVRLKIYRGGRAVPLCDILPMLENMGLKVMEEIPHAIKVGGGAAEEGGANVWVHDFGMRAAHGGGVDIAAVRRPFQEALSRVWNGEMESDAYNRLVIGAGLTAREVTVLRAYGRYLRQVRFSFSQAYMADALLENAAVTRHIIDLFHIRNDPFHNAETREAESTRLEAAIAQELDAIENADHDRILRRFLNLVHATIRTNYYQTEADGSAKPTLAFKLASREVIDLPKPRPWVEVFVYSPRLEAVHLRGGPVARGGIRWSDRPEDYRTEILGLIKAQMVKNAVIVPVGAKGGFLVKRPPAEGGREAFQKEGVECYKLFMRALLGLTDNLAGGKVVPPRDVVRHDGDDPYLVVAADKGTATFSDIANAESGAAGFWLSDAFASGGSQGYDHKVMGITARGAWECVKRHFRELGRDIQSEPFDVAAVGDMAGDVFGNGMLQSETIRLIGAFNHMHVFVDPDPDPAASFAERKRLFDTPRLTWADYNPKLLSKGGAVFSRQSKSVTVSPEVQARLGLTEATLPPNELIRAILAAEVDLLFFGGIGTYLRASDETDAEVGDRANDAVRITAKEVRAKVVGEGANLGVTQRSRIEFALRGGRINTDAIDNSAGVDCSDHEVNIKILLNDIVARGDMTMKQRNVLLASMTDEVGTLVLRDNYLQGQALSMMEACGPERLDEQARLIRHLERLGRLDRAIEFLPNEEEIADRIAKRGILTRSESAVVMPYCKLWLFDEIIDSGLPDAPMLKDELLGYFPTPLREGFAAAIETHRLRREIVATVVGNALVNRVGGTLLTEMIEETGRGPADIARAFLVAREAYHLNDLWAEIEAQDNRIPAGVQLDLLIAVNKAARAVVAWILHHAGVEIDIGGLSIRLRNGVDALLTVNDAHGEAAEGAAAAQAAEWVAAGVPEDLARHIAVLGSLVAVPDIVGLAETRQVEIPQAARVYHAVGERFGFRWARDAAARLPVRSHWQKLAIGALIEDFAEQQRDVAEGVLALIPGGEKPKSVDEALAAWTEANAYAVQQLDRLLAEYRESPQAPDLAMLTVAARQTRTMARA
ncbi:NAD-glutamate dehydrogenase [Oleispirillum naphthae]|uniref:NAD-glutamate dehydrogenase n=1 Tax=Oleispirillum naphthae TaxID=2838853 RepID=UPI0030822FD3